MAITRSLTGAISEGAGAAMFRNRIINGDMRIDQRNAGASVTPATPQYTLDRWYAENGGVASIYSVQQNAGSATPPASFSNYLGVTSTSSYTPASGDNFSLQHRIEGYNTADLAWGTVNAKPVTLSFWVRSSLTGTFGGEIFLAGTTGRSYPYNYTISSVNTWEYKTITIPGDTYTNTISSTTSFSLIVVFMLGSGSSTVSSTANTWQTGNFLAPTGCVNVVSTSGATFYITGVQLEKGTAATPFEYRNYGAELALCQRYYWRIYAINSNERFALGSVGTSTTASGLVPFPVTMRSKPTALEQSGTATDYSIAWAATGLACSSVPTFSASGTTTYNSLVVFTVASGMTAGQVALLSGATANSYLGWSAEL
jgi:hypothetical protein